MSHGIAGLERRQPPEYAATQADHQDGERRLGRQYAAACAPGNPGGWHIRVLSQPGAHAPEHHYPGEAGEPGDIERGGQGQVQRSGGASQQRAGTYAAQHTAREQGEIFGPLARFHQQRHDDWAQGIEHAPAQAKGQSKQHQALAKPRRQGKPQAGHHQQ